MTNRIDSIDDLNLDLFERVTRDGAKVQLSAELADRIDARRQRFLNFVASNRESHLYGITTRHHVGAKHVLGGDEFDEFASRLPASGSTLGQRLPNRVVRGILLTRITDFINGSNCPRSSLVTGILDMLERDTLPGVPVRGNGEPGDIIPLGHLFRKEFAGRLEIGEGMALINGSPVSSALLADIAVSIQRLPQSLENVFSLAAYAVGAPMQHYETGLGELWKDAHIKASLDQIRVNLEHAGGVPRRAYQAPVSFRSAPRMLGWLRRTVEMIQELAVTALSASSNNPAFFDEGESGPEPTIASNGGYHNPYASPGLDAVTRSLADIAQLLAALNNQVTEGPGQLLTNESEAELATLYHVSTGWAEEARAAAPPTLMSLGNPGQTDTGTLDLLAWRKATEAYNAVVMNLTILAATAAHAAYHKDLVPQGHLGSLSQQILQVMPVGTRPIEFEETLQLVQRALGFEIHTAEQQQRTTVG